VFTDTDDFTRLVARHGILHFLMLFDRAVAAATPAVKRHGGDVVKVEGDSLLLRFDDVRSACRAVDGIEAALARLRRGKPAGQFLAFSYGIGFGDVLDLENDVFGLEVNLASKLGEDMAERGEVLLTPAAAAELPRAMTPRLRAHAVATFEGRALPIQRLRPKAS
jgi:class 3 adenylate cyclase